MEQMSTDAMAHLRVKDVIRKIMPWALDRNAHTAKYRTNYKGVRGRIGIVGGARDYAGAPYFASISAMKLGADLAYVICSSGASQTIKAYSPDLIVTPLLDCKDEKEFDNEMDCLLTRLHALVIGPGLGREKLMLDRAEKLIEKAKSRSLPLVLDADSISLVINNPSIIKGYPKALLTPNKIELQRLLNVIFSPKSFDLRDVKSEELRELVKQCSQDLQVSILAKGMVDIASSQSGEQLLTDVSLGSNRRVGGQGDMIAGMAGAYVYWIEQAMKSGDTFGANTMALAGHLAATTTRICNQMAHKEQKAGMLTSDMIAKIGPALDSLLNNDNDKVKHDSYSKHENTANGLFQYSGEMSFDEIRRYNRHMIMPDFGPQRQLKLRQTSVIIIGAGGLGCPAAIYLAGAGIGRLGIVDNDTVEVSNLHRQVVHNLERVGMLKTESIKQAIVALNPNVQVDTHSVRMSRDNAVNLISGYDIVLDATDNILARYMISDACVVAKKPLVSGAALEMNGQLSVYNYDAETPCFRCLFPVPPPPNAVGSCSDNGVLGVIPGVIGIHQALEAIKIGSGMKPAYAGKMLLYDGQLGLFRHVTLGKRKSDCDACGPKSSLDANLINYEEFCGQSGKCQPTASAAANVLEASERISMAEYRDNILQPGRAHVLIDVRPMEHSSVSRFAHAIQIPVIKLLNEPDQCVARIAQALDEAQTEDIYVVCRRGIASQRGTKLIKQLLAGHEKHSGAVVKDLVGGMTYWSASIDNDYACV